MEEELKGLFKGEICPYCQCTTELVPGELIYPHRAHEHPRPAFLEKKYYLCRMNSDHYVGTYDDNITSLGRIADAELRNLKQQGHRAFDPLWKDKTHFNSQKAAYKWLSEKMNLPIEITHFGMFTNEQCADAIEYCHKLTGMK